MRKRRGRQLILLLVWALFLSGCAVRGEKGADEYDLYYVDTEEPRLVTRECRVPGDTVEEKIEKMLRLLEDDTDTIDYESVFADGVKVTDWELKETKLDLFFDSRYSGLSSVEEVLLRAGVVQSLVQIEGVDYIRLFAGDSPVTDASGEELGYLRAEDFVQNTGSSLHSYQTAELTLYFADATGGKLSLEDREVRYNSNMPVEKVVVEQLMKGPTAKGDKPVIPADTKLLGVSLREGICYVNFDEGFLNVAEQVEPKITVYALVNSIIDSGTVGQVQILVNGETDLTYRESIDLSKPLSRDEGLSRGGSD